MPLIHTGTLRIEEFALAGDKFRECGLIDVEFDVEIYDNNDWTIGRVGFVSWNSRKEQTFWLTDQGDEGLLAKAIIQRAYHWYGDQIEEFVREELREVA